MREYSPAVPVVMRLIKQGKLTLKDAGDILNTSPKTVQNLMKEFGIEVLIIGTAKNRKEASEANKKRNELLTTLAKLIKYEKADINELAETHNIPSRTLYRWLHRV
jgi:predicted Rossmann fold nucleotide-binding protein DprA/Smf involved in DNA uptake